MLQAVIFDYDGTLAPTQERQFNWFRHWWNHPHNEKKVGGKSFPYSDLQSFIRMYNCEEHKAGGVQNVYNFLNLDCDMSDRSHPVWNSYINYLEENPNTLYSGMNEAVREIWELGELPEWQMDGNHINGQRRNKRLRLGINTNNTWKSVRKDLKKNDVLKYFDSFVTEEVLKEYHGAGNSDQLKKPSSISLALMLGMIDTEGAYTLHVGDTLNDLAASQKVMRLNPMRPETLITVGVSWGYEGKNNLEKGVEVPGKGKAYFNHIIEKPSQLVNIVKDYMKE